MPADKIDVQALRLPSREVTQEQIEAWDNEAIELARDEILANPVCAPFHALHQRHFAALAHAAGFEAGRKAGGRDGERLRAIIEHGWIVVRDLEGEWQIKAPRRYGAPVLIAESMSLFHAIDLADAAIDRAMTEEPKS